MIKYYCKNCKGRIIPYKIKHNNNLNVTYIYGTCACELEYNKYSDIISSPHKRIDITNRGIKVWNLKMK